MNRAAIILVAALAGCGSPIPPEPDKWIKCVWPADGKTYRLNVKDGRQTIAIPGPSYVTFTMPNGKKWEMTEQDGRNFCEQESKP